MVAPFVLPFDSDRGLVQPDGHGDLGGFGHGSKDVVGCIIDV